MDGVNPDVIAMARLQMSKIRMSDALSGRKCPRVDGIGDAVVVFSDKPKRQHPRSVRIRRRSDDGVHLVCPGRYCVVHIE